VVDACSAAAEPTRRRILQLLASRPRTVGEIAAEFPVTRSAIYQHLPSGLQKLQTEIDRFWTDELDLLVADAHRRRRRT
jgi:DNA-binding transcriptional ArsR family regulator